MPRRIKAALEEHLEATGQFDCLHEYMFFDDTASTGSEQTRNDSASGEELVRRALCIAARSSDCSRMLSDESAWNNLTSYSTTTNIDPAYQRFPGAASRVDYVLQLLPERDPTTNRSHEALAPDMAPCFN
ncbi:hypothetical protein LRP88_00620 [Fusarium phalaenopsidis]